MMRGFHLFISYLFHPILIPIAGTLAYFLITPKYSTSAFQSGTVLPIFILTVIIPIISFLILKNLGLVHSVLVPTVKERKYPLYIGIVLLLMIIYKVIPNNFTAELHFYFIGLVIGTFTCLALLLFKFKSSIHLMGMGSLFMFLVSLSIHFEINITLALSLFILATGVVASSRLYLRAHQKPEIIIGFCIGSISQLLLVQFWL
jgi:hypothetical protein